MRKRTLLLVLTVAACVLCPTASFGQWDYGQSAIDNIIESRIDARKTAERIRERQGRSESKDQSSESTASNKVLGDSSFTASRTRILPARLAQQNAKTPQQAKQVEADVNQMLQVSDGDLRLNKLPLRDVASADSAMISAFCYIYNDGEALPDEKRQQIYQTFASNYAHSREFQSMTNADKQLEYEARLYFRRLLLVGYVTAKEQNNQEMIKKTKETAEKIFKQMYGFSLEKASKEFRR